jgi:prefoldin subunit 5
MTRRLTDSIESLGDIIQEYAKKQKSLDSKLKEMERKAKSVPRHIVAKKADTKSFRDTKSLRGSKVK